MEYKGYGGSKIIIDGDNLIVKELFQQEECSFSDIRSIKFNEPTMLKNGSIVICIKVQHAIFFTSKHRDTFYDVYQEMLSKSNLSEAVDEKKISEFMTIDNANRTINFKFGITNRVIRFSDVLDYELIEDNSSVIKGGAGKALVGGLLFGGVGAIVGSAGKKKSNNIVEKMQLVVRVNDLENPTIIIPIIKSSTKKSSIIYTSAFKSAQNAITSLDIITHENVQLDEQKSFTQLSGADEILKFKQLLDQGIISQEEFDTKKKQLLEL